LHCISNQGNQQYHQQQQQQQQQQQMILHGTGYGHVTTTTIPGFKII